VKGGKTLPKNNILLMTKEQEYVKAIESEYKEITRGFLVEKIQKNQAYLIENENGN
jgi:hypothetical protein